MSKSEVASFIFIGLFCFIAAINLFVLLRHRLGTWPNKYLSTQLYSLIAWLLAFGFFSLVFWFQQYPQLAIGVLLLVGIVNLVVLALQQKLSYGPKFVSMIPLVALLFGIPGFVLMPELRWFCWLPLLADPGNAELLVHTPSIIRQAKQAKQVNSNKNK